MWVEISWAEPTSNPWMLFFLILIPHGYYFCPHKTYSSPACLNHILSLAFGQFKCRSPSLLTILVTSGQTQTKNTKWKIPEIKFISVKIAYHSEQLDKISQGPTLFHLGCESSLCPAYPIHQSCGSILSYQIHH